MPSNLDSRITWTKTGGVFQIWTWVMSSIVLAISFGRFGRGYDLLNEHRCFAGTFSREEISGPNLRRAFKLAVQNLSPIPVSDAEILAKQVEDRAIHFVILRRQKPIRSLRYIGCSAGGDHYVSKAFATVSLIGVFSIMVAFIGMFGFSVWHSGAERAMLIEQLEDLRFSNDQLRGRLLQSQATSQSITETEAYIDQFHAWNSVAAHQAAWESLANWTPDHAWWNAVEFEGQTLNFEMRGENATSIIADIVRNDVNQKLSAGPRITVDRPGVESFSLIAASPPGEVN